MPQESKHVHSHTHTHTHTHTHIHTYTYTHTHIHIHQISPEEAQFLTQHGSAALDEFEKVSEELSEFLV